MHFTTSEGSYSILVVCLILAPAMLHVPCENASRQVIWPLFAGDVGRNCPSARTVLPTSSLRQKWCGAAPGLRRSRLSEASRRRSHKDPLAMTTQLWFTISGAPLTVTAAWLPETVRIQARCSALSSIIRVCWSDDWALACGRATPSENKNLSNGRKTYPDGGGCEMLALFARCQPANNRYPSSIE